MNRSPIQTFSKIRLPALQRGAMFAWMILGALLAFEIFNYSTTDYALTDLLGSELTFLGIRWATILSVAFCGIDFAGIARLFTPEQGNEEPAEVWYLFGAWVLAAAMNAILTWWGVSLAVVQHTNTLSSAILPRDTLVTVVPVFVALMVWVIRILIIGTFSVAGERLFSVANTRPQKQNSVRNNSQPASNRPVGVRPEPTYNRNNNQRPQVSYHPVGMAASQRENNSQTRR